MTCNIDRLQDQVKTRKETLDWIGNILLHLKGEVTVGDWTLSSMEEALRVALEPGELHTFRQEMRKALGSWQDKVDSFNPVAGDWINVNYTVDRWPILMVVREDASTIDLAAYGMPHCSLVEHVPEYKWQEKWTVECPKEKDEYEEYI